jgi:hypothetical protein
MTNSKDDIIYKTIEAYYKKNSGLGTETLKEIQYELKGLYNIDLEAGILNKRIQDYIGSRFSGR